MIKYFPFDRDEYEMAMNARAGIGALIEIDLDEYHSEIALKNEILATDIDYYFQCPREAEPFAWETIALLLPEMAAQSPGYFSLECPGDRWTWTNRLLNTVTNFTLGDSQSLPLAPLDWMGRQVQEDLLLIAETSQGDMICVGGHLCFGSGWCLGDKLGKNFLDIHEPVPEFFERIGRSSNLMIKRLKTGRPTGRLNWTISSTDRLNLAPVLAHEWTPLRRTITPENAGDRCFLRIERQAFARLPKTRGILFTIHTYRNSISEVVADPIRLRRFTSVVNGIPKATRDYKGMTDFADALVTYLEERCQSLGPTTPGE